MPTKVTLSNRRKRIQEKLGIFTEDTLSEMIRTAKDKDQETDPKKIDTWIKLYDRIQGYTPGTMPRSKPESQTAEYYAQPNDIELPDITDND